MRVAPLSEGKCILKAPGAAPPGGWSGPAVLGDVACDCWVRVGFLDGAGGAVVGVSPDPYLAFVAAAHDGGLG